MIREARATSTGPRRHPRRREPRCRPPDADRRTRRAGRAFEPAQAPTIERVLHLLAAAAPDLGRWLSLGLALLTGAMLQLWRGAHSGLQGIFKSAILDLPLSITTVPVVEGRGRPYEDEIGEDGLLRYRYRGTKPELSRQRRSMASWPVAATVAAKIETPSLTLVEFRVPGVVLTISWPSRTQRLADR